VLPITFTSFTYPPPSQTRPHSQRPCRGVEYHFAFGPSSRKAKPPTVWIIRTIQQQHRHHHQNQNHDVFEITFHFLLALGGILSSLCPLERRINIGWFHVCRFPTSDVAYSGADDSCWPSSHRVVVDIAVHGQHGQIWNFLAGRLRSQDRSRTRTSEQDPWEGHRIALGKDR